MKIENFLVVGILLALAYVAWRWAEDLVKPKIQLTPGGRIVFPDNYVQLSQVDGRTIIPDLDPFTVVRTPQGELGYISPTSGSVIVPDPSLPFEVGGP